MLTPTRILAISVVRLVYLSRSIHSDKYFFAYVDTEILTQVEMSFALISATVPTLQIFLKAAKSSLLGETVHTIHGNHQQSFGGSRDPRNPSGKVESRLTSRSRANDEQYIELSDRNNGKRSERISKESHGRSLASDSSERRIVVHPTFDIQIDSHESHESLEPVSAL